MAHAIIRGRNGRRHEVDFQDSPVRVEIYASEETIEIFVEADFETHAEERRRFAVINIPRNLFSEASGASNAVPSETAGTATTPRDRHLQAIAEHGRVGWQKASGYNWRALVEADFGRWKRVIGHALRSQTEKRQATEVALAVDVLNRMLALGRPSYVRIV